MFSAFRLDRKELLPCIVERAIVAVWLRQCSDSNDYVQPNARCITLF